MKTEFEALLTEALCLQTPWMVKDVKVDAERHRIDVEIGFEGARLVCTACGATTQPVHDRLRRSWRHLDFDRLVVWLHCDVPLVGCAHCGKTTQASVPWAQAGSGFTAAYEAAALSLC